MFVHNSWLHNPTPVSGGFINDSTNIFVHIWHKAVKKYWVLDLSSVVIRTRDQIWFRASHEVINAIHSFWMPIQCKVWRRWAEIPNLKTGSIALPWPRKSKELTKQQMRINSDLYGAIKRSTCKSVCVFGTKCHLHHIVGMSLERLSTLPTLLPIPKLYEHVIRSWQHIWKGRMDCNTPNEISMRLKFCNLLHCIVVEDSDKLVISPSNNPLFACYKLGWPNCMQTHIQLLNNSSNLVKKKMRGIMHSSINRNGGNMYVYLVIRRPWKTLKVPGIYSTQV